MSILDLLGGSERVRGNRSRVNLVDPLFDAGGEVHLFGQRRGQGNAGGGSTAACDWRCDDAGIDVRVSSLRIVTHHGAVHLR